MKIKKLLRSPIVYIAVLIFLNIFYKGLFTLNIPGGIAPHELDLLRLYSFPVNINFYYFRFFSIAFTSLASVCMFIYVYRTTKSNFEAFMVGCIFVISPWIFMISRSLNYYSLFVFFFSLILLIPNRKVSLFFFYIFIFLIIVATNIKLVDLIHNMQNATNIILQSLDLRSLFFIGDNASATMRIPRTGFFMMIDFIPLLAGYYRIRTIPVWRNQIIYLLFLFLGGFMLSISNTNSLLLFRNSGIFFIISIIIGLGYYQLICCFAFHKQKIISLIFSLTVLLNIFYFQELFYNHFDKMNSTEWGFAEINLILNIKNAKNIKKIYVTSKKSELRKYISYFLPEIIIYDLPENMIISICKDGYNKCIVKEDELLLLGIDKGKIRNIFINKGGLPEFFLL